MSIRKHIAAASDSVCASVTAWGPLAQSLVELVHRLYHIFFGGHC